MRLRQAPPIHGRSRLTILRIPPNTKFQVTLLNREVVGVWVHWNGRQNVICDRPDPCDLCDTGRERRWQGFFAVKSRDSGDQFVIQVTPRVIEDLADHISKEQGYSGMKISLQRKNGNPNSPLSTAFLGRDSHVNSFSMQAIDELVEKVYHDERKDRATKPRLFEA